MGRDLTTGSVLKNIVYFEQGCYNVTVIKRD